MRRKIITPSLQHFCFKEAFYILLNRSGKCCHKDFPVLGEVSTGMKQSCRGMPWCAASLVLRAHGLHPPKAWFVGAKTNWLQLLNIAMAGPDHKHSSLWELKSYLADSRFVEHICTHISHIFQEVHQMPPNLEILQLCFLKLFIPYKS